MYIGDSQSMAVESALLGTPGVRFNDFSGEIGVLNELEDKYQLTYSFKTNQVEEFFNQVEEMLKDETLKKDFLGRREKMLSEKINVFNFFIWFIQNYPKSFSVMKQNPDYQLKFK